jgi:RNase H-like domain found in reverse transcriptase
MQGNQPIVYMSKALGPKNQALSIYEKEFMALLSTVYKWRHYLVGKQFVINTDHISLKYLLDQKLTHYLQHKGLCKLLGSDYVIQYKKGIENKAAADLYRLEREKSHGNVLVVTEILSSWLEVLKASHIQDEWAKLVLQGDSLAPSKEKDVIVHKGIIRCQGRTYVGTYCDWRGKMVKSLHDSGEGDHSGILGTYHRIKRLFC